jgi:hypothetical protein
MILRVLIFTALAYTFFTLAANQAQAQERPTAMVNISESDDGLLYAAIRQADKFWRSYGKNPCRPTIYVYDEVDAENQDVPAANGVVARAHYPEHGCAVFFERYFVRYIREDIAQRWRWGRTLAYREVCQVAAHERGHNLGLRHDERKDQLMSASLSEGTQVPFACRTWARRMAN